MVVIGVSPLNFFMTRLLFVDNKDQANRVADIPVIQDNSHNLPEKVSRSAGAMKRKRCAMDDDVSSASTKDLPPLSKTYSYEAVLDPKQAERLHSVMFDHDKPKKLVEDTSDSSLNASSGNEEDNNKATMIKKESTSSESDTKRRRQIPAPPSSSTKELTSSSSSLESSSSLHNDNNNSNHKEPTNSIKKRISKISIQDTPERKPPPPAPPRSSSSASASSSSSPPAVLPTPQRRSKNFPKNKKRMKGRIG